MGGGKQRTVQGNDIGTLQKSFTSSTFSNAQLLEGLVFGHGIVGDLLEPEGFGFLADFLCDGSKTDQTEGQIGKRRQRQKAPNAPPAVRELVVVLRDAATE